jgi:ATP-binding cassette subfamily B protein
VSGLAGAVWPEERLGEALDRLARASELADGLETAASAGSPVDAEVAGDVEDAGGRRDRGAAAAPRASRRLDAGAWIDAALAGTDLEAEAVRCTHRDTRDFLRRAGPALVRVEAPPGAPARFLAIAGARGGRVRLVGTDGELRSVRIEEVRARLWAAAEEAFAPAVERMLADAEVAGSQRGRVAARLLAEHLGEQALGGAWCLRLAPGAGAWRQARRLAVPRRLAGVALAHLAAWGVFLAAWVAIGRGALEGRFEGAWIAAWVLLLVTGLPFRLLESWMQGALTLDVGALFKRRLLAGALKLEPEETRRQGVGQLLGRVLESEAVETLALGSGFLAIAAVIELGLAAWVLAQGPGPVVAPALLALWVLLALALGVRAYARGRTWTRARLALTHDLVERMVGHRTRRAQEAREHWNAGEDELLESYLGASARLDQNAVLLASGLSSAWLAVGILGIAPAFLSGDASTTALAIGLGGILLGQQAVAKLAGSLSQVAALRVAWEEIRALHHAAARPEPAGVPGCEPRGAGPETGAPPLLEARRLGLAYPDRAGAAVDAADLCIARGDRLLLEGPSGGGKSSLAALLLGLRAPTSGILLLHGLDRATWGADGWRRRIAAAPQSHENHVFSGTLAFNLLLARDWPPAPEDLDDARAVCVELGLGPLLERMPAGLQQTVGETGWQLSHGERSRVFVARALLQGGDLQVFDESFAALDPGTLRRALECVLRRAPSVLVVAHP